MQRTKAARTKVMISGCDERNQECWVEKDDEKSKNRRKQCHNRRGYQESTSDFGKRGWFHNVLIKNYNSFIVFAGEFSTL